VRIELRDWLRQLHTTTHLTTILVTHDQGEALELSDCLVVMNEGRVHQVGPPQEVYDQPLTPFVASFVGSSNVLQGHVSGGRASLGSLSVAVPEGLPEGAKVQAIVRPHDFKLEKTVNPLALSVGRITRVVGLGATVKLELCLPSNAAVTVHMARGELDALGIESGDHVIVDVAGAKIFVEDYSI
jgi:sulfate transport system ATP-binding protein